MDWYYASKGRQRGPVSDADWKELVRQGEIHPFTLVWHAGLADWQTWQAVSSRAGTRGAWSAEPTRGRLVYAGFWIRALAYVIDGGLIGVIRSIALWPMGMSMLDRPFASPWFFTHFGEAKLAGLAIGLAYFVYFWTQHGATPGKMLLGLKVITPEGGLISAGQGVIHYFSQILSGILMGIGFLMACWDGEKRALHDRLASTRVIRTGATPAGL